jgi:hypothetical protein
MKQKLTVLIVVTLLLSLLAFLPSGAWCFNRQIPSRIPSDHILSPLFSGQEKGSTFCIIHNDDGTPRWFYAGFDLEMGAATYMDPAKCTSQPIYPFNITDVHFYLYHNGAGWSWPLHIQVNIKEVTPGDKCLGPDPSAFLFSQSFVIPVDSSFDSLGRPMILNLTPQTCVSQPFFLEIKYQDTFAVGDTLPSLLMDSAVTSPDTCNNWLRWVDGTYYEWFDAWEPPPPGDVFIQASGYTNAECWYWKPKRPDAPNGMPDFDQYQFGPPDSEAFCGPTAVANCLWWFGAVPPEMNNPRDFILLLAQYFHTDPANGTYVDSIQNGLDQYFQYYGFNYYEKTFYQPHFKDMEDSLKLSQDIILLLEFWEWTGVEWVWRGGHFTTMAGVHSESLKVAFSDPARDNAEGSGPGRVLPPHDPHPSNDTLHNDPAYVSHDIYQSDTLSPSPGNPHWGLTDYITDKSFIDRFLGKNMQPRLEKSHLSSSPVVGPIYCEVSYAVMICPKPSAVEEEEGGKSIPQNFELYQNHPNPFNSETVIKFNLLKPSFVTLVVYNILGQKVRTLVTGHLGAGERSTSWDGKDEQGNDLASGIYFYRLNGSGMSQTKRLVLLK